jgi:DNA-binding HxlR family transcriptional regulator
MSVDERKIAERMLMLELKELQKENWVNAEVSEAEEQGFSCFTHRRG